jgi:mRNA interferase RelE/StbE
MRFKLTKYAKKYLDTLEKDSVNRIYEGLRKLTKEPPEGDIKPIKGSDDHFRLRIGDFRILFEIEGNHAIIEKIRPRGKAYKQ